MRTSRRQTHLTVFFWFAGLSFAIVLVVFSSPALDFRLVMLGSVLPLAESVLGGAYVLHTLLGAVVLLTVVMAATVGRRLRRRRWLGLAIGVFMHLVLDGAWATTELFWWPFLGASDVLGVEAVPELERTAGVLLVMELAGLVVLAWLTRRLDLLGEGRDRFLRSGQVPRDRLA